MISPDHIPILQRAKKALTRGEPIALGDRVIIGELIDEKLQSILAPRVSWEGFVDEQTIVHAQQDANEARQLVYAAKRSDYRNTHGFRTTARGKSDERD